jgi:phage terminase large subunit-like protein
MKSVIIGSSLPRITTTPTTNPTKGKEVKDLAIAIGMPLMPWQEYVIDDASALVNEKWEHKTVGVLVARQNGKTHLLRMRILAGLFLWDEKLQLATAQNRDVALETFKHVVEMIDGYSWLSKKVKAVTRANGREEIELKNGCRYKIIAPTPGAARGLTANTVYLDEARQHRTTDGFAALAYTMQASKNPQMWITSNAGDIHSVVLNQIRNRALKKIENNTIDDIGWYEWSAEPGLKLADRKAWAQANPALGHTITEDVLQARMGDQPEIIQVEMLCQWVSTILSPWPHGSWTESTQPELKLAPDRPTWIGVELSPDRTSYAIVGSQILDDGNIAVALMDLTESDKAIDDLRIADRVAQWAKSYTAEAIVLNKFSGDSIASKLIQAGLRAEIIAGAKYYQACDETLGAMTGGRLTHGNQPELTSSVNACIKKTTETGGWYVMRRKESTAAIAMMLAIHKAMERKSSNEVDIAIA